MIYLSLPSVDGANGNSVQILNPETGTLGTSSFAGSEPFLLAVSANSKYLYVSQAGAATVQRMTLPDLMNDSTIQLGSDSFFGPFFAMDLQAAPNADGTVAVVRGAPHVSPEEEGGVVIYDNGVTRPNVLCGFIQSGCTNGLPAALYDSIQWNTDATEMFAANNEDTAFDFYTLPVDLSGFGTPTDYPNLVPDFFAFIHYDAHSGRVYDDDGEIVDPTSGTVVGTFAASGLMVPDGTLGVAFFLGQTQQDFGGQTYTLESFDLQKFTPIATLRIPDVVGSPTKLIRWGTSGLAFTTSSSSGGNVVVINSSFVSGSNLFRGPAPSVNVQRTWKTPKVFGMQHN